MRVRKTAVRAEVDVGSVREGLPLPAMREPDRPAAAWRRDELLGCASTGGDLRRTDRDHRRLEEVVGLAS